MTIDWNTIRYRGDAADVKELFDAYRVGDYIDAFEENRRRQEQGMREELLKNGILLTERLSPRIYRLFREVTKRLAVDASEEIICLPGQEINAFALLDVQEAGTHSVVGVTAGALEQLDDRELQFVLGHELGHFLFGNNRLNALISHDKSNPSATVLPPLGESLFLRWRKKAEISADRVGLMACGDFNAGARALMKTTFGLSERNLNLDIEALLKQIDELKGSPELMDEAFASHPLLPIRLKALQLFALSGIRDGSGDEESQSHTQSDVLENQVDSLVQLTQRYPHKPFDEAMMRAIALGGALLLSEDGDISDEEVKILINILHGVFTDEPEKEILTDRDDIQRKLSVVLKVIKEEGEPHHKAFVISRLVDIALADGALLEAEGSVILTIAREIGVSEKHAYGAIVGAAQAVGFRTDVKLNRIAETLRRSLQIGFQAKSNNEQKLI